MLIDTLNVGLAGSAVGYIVARQQLLGWRGAFIDLRMDRSNAISGAIFGVVFILMFWLFMFLGQMSLLSTASITVAFSISAAICVCTYRELF
jgi:ABC-type sulfate transport system permease subunit